MTFEFPNPHLFSIDEWHHLGRTSVFNPENHLQLINGEILDMGPISPNHAGHRMRLTSHFSRLSDIPAIIGINHPIQLSRFSEAHADLALLAPESNDYTTRHPSAADVLLLVEVSDSTLRFDKTTKLRLYASHVIPEYWIVNLIDNCLEVYRHPQDGDYLDKTVLSKSDSLTLQALPNIQIAVAEIL